MPETIVSVSSEISVYIPEWERPECPTRRMSQSAMLAYYKRTAALGDARFYAAVWRRSPEHADQAARLALTMAEHVERGKPIPKPLIGALKALKAAYAAACPSSWLVVPKACEACGEPVAVCDCR